VAATADARGRSADAERLLREADAAEREAQHARRAADGPPTRSALIDEPLPGRASDPRGDRSATETYS
jgi:hypothetical protein